MNDIMRTQCPLLADFLRGYALMKNAFVLDIGCGSAWYWPFLSPRAMVGVDAWAGMRPDICCAVGIPGSSPLPFKDRAFDVALLLDVIEHVPRPAGEIMLKEAQRLAPVVLLLTPLFWTENMEQINDPASAYYGNGWNKHMARWGIGDFAPTQGWTRINHVFHKAHYYFGEWRAS